MDMNIPQVSLGNRTVSRFIVGGNPFSGFSHQGVARDREMVDFYTVERIKDTLRAAEDLGINTFLGRADRHIIRMLMEYRNDGGGIQWFAQTCPEMQSTERSVQDAIDGGADAVYIHGGVMDYLIARGCAEEVIPAIETIRDAGLPAGIAGHDPRVHQWAEKHLDLDFYMCSYYNSAHRDENAEHIHGRPEWFNDEDRRIMTELIQTLSKPVIHYKILAAGRNDPADAIPYAVSSMRPGDAACVGVFTKDDGNMIADDLRLFLDAISQ